MRARSFGGKDEHERSVRQWLTPGCALRHYASRAIRVQMRPMTAKQITIAPRFNGPANSGNGGYVNRLMAREIYAPSLAETLWIEPRSS